VPVLEHSPSGAAFTFDWDEENHRHLAIYVPGAEQPVDVRQGPNWYGELLLVKTWLEYLRREYYAPNLWGELERQRELAAETQSQDEESDAPFTAAEQAEIAVQLGEIKELLARTEQLEGARLRALEARLEYLEDASTRMSRKDWLTMFYGTVFSWALTGLI